MGSSIGWGYIDRRGKVVTPCEFSAASDFHSGLAKVTTRSGMTGFIDTRGQLKFFVNSRPFSTCSDFSEGYCVINEGNVKKVIDTRGQVKFTTSQHIGQFHEGLCCLCQVTDGHCLYGYIDRSFQWKIKPRYRWAFDFSENIAAVCFYDPKKIAEDEAESQSLKRKNELEDEARRAQKANPFNQLNRFLRRLQDN